MHIRKINIEEKLNLFSDHWNPRIIAELNGQHIKLVKFTGEFVWHKHEKEEEMFLVISGQFTMELRDQRILLKSGELLVIPRGVEHRPVAKEEVKVMLFEPAGTLNTGNLENKLTNQNLERI